MNEAQKVGRRLWDVRVWRGLTRKQVCTSLGKNTATLFRYEKGESEPNLEVMRQLCELYGVSRASIVDPPKPHTTKATKKTKRAAKKAA